MRQSGRADDFHVGLRAHQRHPRAKLVILDEEDASPPRPTTLARHALSPRYRPRLTRRILRADGDAREDGRALARRGLNLEPAPDVGGALAHVQHPDVFTVRLGDPFRLEASAVVFDDERDVMVASLQKYVNAFGLRVLGDVIQSLLRMR